MTERILLQELTASRIPTSDYNLPDWEETVDGLQALLSSLFRVTPPTAIIIGESQFFSATQQFLARKGLRVPEQVSVVCIDSSTCFNWCMPTIAHILWESAPVVRRIVQWAANVSKGREDKNKLSQKGTFIPGGTIGPARAS